VEMTFDLKPKMDRDQSLERQAKEIMSRKRILTGKTPDKTSESEAKKLVRQKDNQQMRAPRKEAQPSDRKNLRLYSKSPDVFTARQSDSTKGKVEKLCNN